MTKVKFDYIKTKIKYVQSLALLKGEEQLVIDTETYALPEYGLKGSALDPHTGRISLMILKGRTTIPQVLDILCLEKEETDFDLLKDLLYSREWLLFHNSRFDLKFMQSTFGWMPTNVRDTLIMAKLCSNATGSKVGKVTGHGYADLCRDYLDIHITGKSTLRESTWYIELGKRTLENEWWLEKLEYAANDVQYLFELHDIMYPVLTEPLPHSPLTKTGNRSESWGLGMQEVLAREFKYIICVARREYLGLPVSKEMMQVIQAATQEKLEEIGAQLCYDFDLDLPKPDWQGIPKPSEKSLKTLRSSSGMAECVRKALQYKKLDSVQADTLKRLLEIIEILSAAPREDTEGNLIDSHSLVSWIDEEEENLYRELEDIERSILISACPIMQRVLDFKTMAKQAGMNLTKFINPVTGRIHPSFDQLGASTGRSACSSPNLQQVSGKTPIFLHLDSERLERLLKSTSQAVKL